MSVIGNVMRGFSRGGLIAAMLFLGVHDIVQVVRVHKLAAENVQLANRIDDPATGYVVKLAQAETNTRMCTIATEHQSDAIRAQGAKSAAAVAAVKARYDAEHVARERAEVSAAVILAHRPQGSTLADRVSDVDAQILGDLK